MPPGPAYNFLCVLSSVADILTHATRIRAAQTGVSVPTIISATRKRRKIDPQDNADLGENEPILSSFSEDSSTKENTIRVNIDLPRSNLSAYPAALSANVLLDLSPLTSESPEARIHTYEPVPEKLIHERRPQVQSLGNSAPNVSSSESSEAEVNRLHKVSASV